MELGSSYLSGHNHGIAAEAANMHAYQNTSHPMELQYQACRYQLDWLGCVRAIYVCAYICTYIRMFATEAIAICTSVIIQEAEKKEKNMITFAVPSLD